MFDNKFDLYRFEVCPEIEKLSVFIIILINVGPRIKRVAFSICLKSLTLPLAMVKTSTLLADINK